MNTRNSIIEYIKLILFIVSTIIGIVILIIPSIIAWLILFVIIGFVIICGLILSILEKH